MRILFAHNDYGIWTGEEASAEKIAKLLSDHGHEVFWFRRSSHKLWLRGSFFGKAAAFVTGIHNPIAARDIALMLDEIKPDLVQVQNLYPFLSPSILRPIKKRGIPIVMRCPNYRLFCPNGLHFSKGRVCERCTSFGGELWCILKNCQGNIFKSTGYALRNAWARINKTILKNVDIFIVQTQFQKAKFVENGISPDRIEILPGMAPPLDISSNGQVGDSVVFVGRPSMEKGIGTLLEAAQTTPKILFSIAGDSPKSGQYMSRTPNNVRWLGFLKGEALFDLYRSARFVIAPSSWYEGFPNVIVKAMMMGKPVISSTIGGIPEIVEDVVTGLLCEPANTRELSEKIQYLWERPLLCKQMGQAGRQKALREYSPEKCYERLIMIYQKATRLSMQRLDV
ncbi:MAG: glycosyltransferase family 4 protein [Sedimentisphaerales bacterium]|nr:glycosyltransferase family 4 protein [Sedimentisphaerales bacterium]